MLLDTSKASSASRLLLSLFLFFLTSAQIGFPPLTTLCCLESHQRLPHWSPGLQSSLPPPSASCSSPSFPPPFLGIPRLRFWLPCPPAGFSYHVPLGPTCWRYWAEWDIGGGGIGLLSWLVVVVPVIISSIATSGLLFQLPAALGDHSIHMRDFILQERP